MAIMGGCKIGPLPVHADLFSHMRDVPALTMAPEAVDDLDHH